MSGANNEFTIRKSMKRTRIRVLHLLVGTILASTGIVTTIRANIGYAPWEVFHVGIAISAGINIGVTTIIVGAAVIIIVTACGEIIGLGTIVNMLLAGLFMDFLFWLDIIPLADDVITGILLLFTGILIQSLGTYFYISAAFGVGPRDNLMVVLKRKTKLPVGICRSIVELTITITGWLLGGMVGIGTIIFVIAIGFCIQITFSVLKLKPTEIKHETIVQTYKAIRGKVEKTKES